MLENSDGPVTKVGGALGEWMGELSTPRLALWFWLAVTLIYLPFATYSTPFSGDVRTNQLTAWKLATSRTFDLSEYRYLTVDVPRGMVTYLADTGDHVVSPYPPGVAVFAAPFYAFSPTTLPTVDGSGFFERFGVQRPIQYPQVPAWPSAVAVCVFGAIGATGILVALLSMGVERRVALIGAGLAAFGTGAFSVGADTLWQHSVSVAFIGLFAALVARDSLWMAGLAAAGAVLTRPPTAFAVAAVGLYLAWRRRSFRPVLAIGLPASLGMAGYVWYQLYYFAEVTRVGYVTAAVGGGVLDDLIGAVRALFDPQRGLFVLTSVALVALGNVVPAWRDSPDWAKGAALGAALLFGFQMRGQAWDGGSGFFGYRYMIEPLFFAVPLLVLGGWHAWRKGGLARKLLVVTAVASVTFHTVGAALPYVAF